MLMVNFLFSICFHIIYLSFLHRRPLDSTLDTRDEQLRCPSSYHQIAVDIIEIMNSTSNECAKECHLNSNCKAFTVVSPKSADQNIDDTLQQDILCVLHRITQNDTSEMKSRFGYKDSDMRAIMCVKKISKFNWIRILQHNI